MVKQIQKWLGLPVCVGVAPSKTLTKVANHWAKKLKVSGSVLMLNDIRNPDQVQLDMFNRTVGNPRLMHVMDKINGRFGKETARFAMQGGNHKKWAMHSKLKTQSYSTSFSEAVKVRQITFFFLFQQLQ